MNEIVNLDGLAASLELKQVETIEMILQGATSEEIRKKIQVTPSQISRWNNNSPEFRAALREAKKQSLQSALHEPALFKGMEKVVEQLLDIMEHAGIDKDRVGAAKVFHDIYRHAKHDSMVSEQLDILKAEIAELKKKDSEKVVADIVVEPYNESDAVISVPIPKGEFDEPV